MNTMVWSNKYGIGLLFKWISIKTKFNFSNTYKHQAKSLEQSCQMFLQKITLKIRLDIILETQLI